jgi:hypothetical protein
MQHFGKKSGKKICQEWLEILLGFPTQNRFVPIVSG